MPARALACVIYPTTPSDQYSCDCTLCAEKVRQVQEKVGQKTWCGIILNPILNHPSCCELRVSHYGILLVQTTWRNDLPTRSLRTENFWRYQTKPRSDGRGGRVGIWVVHDQMYMDIAWVNGGNGLCLFAFDWLVWRADCHIPGMCAGITAWEIQWTK